MGPAAQMRADRPSDLGPSDTGAAPRTARLMARGDVHRQRTHWEPRSGTPVRRPCRSRRRDVAGPWPRPREHGLDVRVVPFGYHPAEAGPLVAPGAAERDIAVAVLGRGCDVRSGRRARVLAQLVPAIERLGPVVLLDGIWGAARDAVLRRTADRARRPERRPATSGASGSSRPSRREPSS